MTGPADVRSEPRRRRRGRSGRPVRRDQPVRPGPAALVTVVSRREYAGSGLTVATNRGGTYRGAADPVSLATEMLAALTGGDGPTLVYARG
jgi:hypothetical protein